ncbi:hypothetical protein CDD83_8784 [Cordyceps sp. RAO-2017]|nr:hypothetical protein CDD83_8784 [Cordyceps sp. RAO-2017]
MDSIEDLRRRLQEEQRRREEAESRSALDRRRREEAESRSVLDQRRREAAEDAAEASRPQTIQQYLESCHSLFLAIEVVKRSSLTTQGETTNPAGRIYPRRILPWDDFSIRQEEIWNELSTGDSSSALAFPSQHQMQYVKSLLKPISSELGLRDFEHDVVENAVQKLVEWAYKDPLLRSRLGLKGTVTFESHLNLSLNDDISESMEQLSLGRDGPAGPASTPKPDPRPRRRARGKGGSLADQFCIYRTTDGVDIPALAIEYKAPHKLSVDEVVTGLESEIQPQRDIINKDGQGFVFAARRLTAAVVTQLFSYMIGKGIQYGYVCTGQTRAFLHIPDDPSTVYVSICVPDQDVIDGDETRLHRTAVAQVFAFLLQALRAKPPPESWHDEAQKLGIWDVEYDDILSRIPETDRKGNGPRNSPYKPQRWTGFKRSPVRTRSGCQLQKPGARRPEDDEPPSPTPKPSRPSVKAASRGTGSAGQEKQGQGRGKKQQSTPATKADIQSRPFCTQRCLMGLAHGGPVDGNCPNAGYHGQKHIDRLEFLRLVREQLAIDRGHDADCTPLHLSGARGSLFKVRLSSHGYTLVAKGMESLDLAHLQHENEIYDRLQPIQGRYVPVCLGSIDLILPYYYNCGVYVQFMFLSWAGQPLFHCADQVVKAGIDGAIGTIFKAMHKLRILHRDAEPRNILYSSSNGQFMAVDFERAEFRGRQPLSSVVPNVQNRKRKREILQKQKDDFTKELEDVVGKASRYAADLHRDLSRGHVSETERDFLDTSFFQSGEAPSPQLPTPSSILEQWPDLGYGVIKLEHSILAVKFGHPSYLILEEAQAMQAIRQALPHNHVPVPEKSLNAADKESICRKLSRIVTILRRITPDSPARFIGSVNGGTIQDKIFKLDYEEGTFFTIKEFNDSMLAAATRQTRGQNVINGPYLDFLPDSGITYFTRGDLTLGSIIISDEPGSRRIVGIVDWEQASWHPEYWEYCKLLYGVEYTHEWREAGWADKIIEPFDDEWTAFAEYSLWRCP